MNPLERKLKFVQRKSTAPTLANIIHNTLGSLLDGVGVDPEQKRRYDEDTAKSLKKCDKISNGNFNFHTIHFYARPIEAIGVHNTVNDEKTSEEEHKYNALKAANGYHHGLLILSYNKPEPTQYLLDRVEGVRFIKIDTVQEEELTSGHLVLIKEYKMQIQYKDIKQFIQREAKLAYNAAKNNCLHFVYKFIDNVLKKNKWDHDFQKFWAYITNHFDANAIDIGEYNQQRNYLLRQKILMEQKIKKRYDSQLRRKWEKGSKIWIKSKNSRATESWFIGKISKIKRQIHELVLLDGTSLDEIEVNVYVQYTKMGKTFNIGPLDIDNKLIKPYIEVM